MPPSEAVGRVVVGTTATVLLSVLALLLLPFLGIATGETVGTWLPPWIFAVPLAMCATVGGALTGFLQRDGWTNSTLFGGLAAALGGTVIGVVVGLMVLLVLLGMTPAHGQEPDISRGVLTMAALGGGAGFVAGAVLGAIGGVGGHLVRQALDV